MPRRKQPPQQFDDPTKRPVTPTRYTERPVPTFDPRCVVDIITPVGPRHVKALANAIRSVELQTIPFPYWRMIVVNDTGRDISEAIKRDDILLLNNLGAHGSSYARNLGLDAAKAPFVLFLDADDWLLNTTLELYLKAYTLFETGYVYGDGIIVKADGSTQYHPPPQQANEFPQYDRSFYLKANQHQITALIPTQLAKDVKFDPAINIWEDYDFYMHMATKGYCGTRIMYPAIMYNWDEGSNRETGHFMDSKANGAEGQLTSRVREKWRAEIERPRMSCCGSGKSEQDRAREALRNTINPNVQGDVPMEWLGLNHGPIRYVSPNRTGREYHLGALPPHRFFMAHPADVEWLVSLNAREQPRPSTPVVIPSASQFVTQQGSQVAPSAPAMMQATESTVVVPPAQDDDFKEL